MALLAPMALADIAMPYKYNDAFGTNQYYSVVFDGEGEAAVAAKLVFQNMDKKEVDTITLEIPGRAVRIISVLQEFQDYQDQCNNWQDDCTKYDGSTCLEYSRRCTNWYKQPGWPMQYSIVNYTQDRLSNSVKITAKLPKKIGLQESTTLLIYYKASGYAESTFGVFSFNYETIKSGFDVNSVRVAINTQDDLYLKGGKANVDYQLNTGIAALSKASESIQSDSLQQFSSSIQWQQGYVKQAAGLDPWESFKVSGKYSSSWLLLNAGTIALWLLAVAVVVFGIVLFIKKRRSAMPIQRKPNQPNPHFRMAMIGLASSVLLLVLWYLIVNFFSNTWRFGNSELVAPMAILVSIVLLLAVFIGPSVYMGINFGARFGFMTFAYTLGWLVLIVVLTVVIMSSLYRPIIYY